MKILLYLLLIIITVFPKVTIISVSNNATGIRIEDLLLLICALFLFLSKYKAKKNIQNIDFRKVKKVFFIYLFACIISTLYGISKVYITPVTSLLFIIRRLEYFLLFYFGYYYGFKYFKKENKYFNYIVLLHFMICVLQLMGLIGSFNHGEMLSALTQGRVSSTFNGAYEMSAFLLIILPYYIYNLFFKKNVAKNLGFILLITFCIIISESRTSLILEFVIILYMLIKNNVFKNKKIMNNLIVIFAMTIIPIIVFIVPKIDLSRFINISFKKTNEIIEYAWNNKDFDNYVRTKSWYGNSNYTTTQIANMGYDDSLYVRISHWMQLIDGWMNSPLIGVGVSISGAACDGNYIKILVETGIIGLVVWIYLLFIINRSLKESKWLKFSFITLIIGASLIDLFDASKVMMFFWFLFGVYLSRKNTINKFNE